MRRCYTIATALFILVLIAIPAMSGEYAALKGVKGVKTVFDVSQGSPQVANIVFWAVRNVHDDKSTRSLSESPQVAVTIN